MFHQCMMLVLNNINKTSSNPDSGAENYAARSFSRSAMNISAMNAASTQGCGGVSFEQSALAAALKRRGKSKLFSSLQEKVNVLLSEEQEHSQRSRVFPANNLSNRGNISDGSVMVDRSRSSHQQYSTAHYRQVETDVLSATACFLEATSALCSYGLQSDSNRSMELVGRVEDRRSAKSLRLDPSCLEKGAANCSSTWETGSSGKGPVWVCLLRTMEMLSNPSARIELRLVRGALAICTVWMMLSNKGAKFEIPRLATNVGTYLARLVKAVLQNEDCGCAVADMLDVAIHLLQQQGLLSDSTITLMMHSARSMNTVRSAEGAQCAARFISTALSVDKKMHLLLETPSDVVSNLFHHAPQIISFNALDAVSEEWTAMSESSSAARLDAMWVVLSHYALVSGPNAKEALGFLLADPENVSSFCQPLFHCLVKSIVEKEAAGTPSYGGECIITHLMMILDMVELISISAPQFLASATLSFCGTRQSVFMVLLLFVFTNEENKHDNDDTLVSLVERATAVLTCVLKGSRAGGNAPEIFNVVRHTALAKHKHSLWRLIFTQLVCSGNSAMTEGMMSACYLSVCRIRVLHECLLTDMTLFYFLLGGRRITHEKTASLLAEILQEQFIRVSSLLASNPPAATSSKDHQEEDSLTVTRLGLGSVVATPAIHLVVALCKAIPTIQVPMDTLLAELKWVVDASSSGEVLRHLGELSCSALCHTTSFLSCLIQVCGGVCSTSGPTSSATEQQFSSQFPTDAVLHSGETILRLMCDKRVGGGSFSSVLSSSSAPVGNMSSLGVISTNASHVTTARQHNFESLGAALSPDGMERRPPLPPTSATSLILESTAYASGSKHPNHGHRQRWRRRRRKLPMFYGPEYLLFLDCGAAASPPLPRYHSRSGLVNQVGGTSGHHSIFRLSAPSTSSGWAEEEELLKNECQLIAEENEGLSYIESTAELLYSLETYLQVSSGGRPATMPVVKKLNRLASLQDVCVELLFKAYPVCVALGCEEGGRTPVELALPALTTYLALAAADKLKELQMDGGVTVHPTYGMSMETATLCVKCIAHLSSRCISENDAKSAIVIENLLLLLSSSHTPLSLTDTSDLLSSCEQLLHWMTPWCTVENVAYDSLLVAIIAILSANLLAPHDEEPTDTPRTVVVAQHIDLTPLLYSAWTLWKTQLDQVQPSANNSTLNRRLSLTGNMLSIVLVASNREQLAQDSVSYELASLLAHLGSCCPQQQQQQQQHQQAVVTIAQKAKITCGWQAAWLSVLEVCSHLLTICPEMASEDIFLALQASTRVATVLNFCESRGWKQDDMFGLGGGGGGGGGGEGAAMLLPLSTMTDATVHEANLIAKMYNMLHFRYHYDIPAYLKTLLVGPSSSFSPSSLLSSKNGMMNSGSHMLPPTGFIGSGGDVGQ